MIKINTILMSLGIVIILLLSGVSSTSMTTTTTPPVSDPLVVDLWPQLEVEKKVWNPTTHQWVESMDANVGDTVRFNITVKYFDWDPNDACRLITRIHVIDHLEDNFKYNDGLSMDISWPSPIDPNAFMTYDSGKKHITWDFSNVVILSETSGYLPSVFYLEFNAIVNTTGNLENYVEVNGTESCCGVWGYSNASAFVNVSPGDCDITVTNEVKENSDGLWSDSGIEIDLCDDGAANWVTFRINVCNTGDIPMSVTVTDTLPAGLIYNDNAKVDNVAREPDYHVGQVLKWYLATLAPGDCVVITFEAKMGQCDILYVNAVNVTGVCDCGNVYDDDTASVKWLCCEPQGTCDITVKKEVKEDCDGPWSDTGIQIDLCDPAAADWVTFRITVTNTGDAPMSVTVTDTLPAGLIYNDNAKVNDIAHPPDSIVGQVLKWYFNPFNPGQTVVITFEAKMGQCDILYVNAVNVTGVCDCGNVYDDDTASVKWLCCDEPPTTNFTCDKKVKNLQTQQWVEEINANIGNTVRFRINLTYKGTGTVINIKVKDILPACLQYANNANREPTALVGKNVFWNLSTTLTNGQSIIIEFDALVISSGTNVNLVNITGLENCGLSLYCQDTATVIVNPPPPLTCDKKVKNPQTQAWVESINASIGDTVRFKITFTYSGTLYYYSIWVNDTLPSCLQYADNANPKETTIVGKTILWHLEIALSPGESYSIEFDVKVISNGTNINTVKITGVECGVRILECTDTATVIVSKPVDPLVARISGPSTGLTDEIKQFTASATGGISPYTYAWDIDNDGYDDGAGIKLNKSWSSEGTYTIKLKVTDSRGINATASAQITISEPNERPNTPSTPTGEKTSGRTNKALTFSSGAVDPDGDQVYLLFDWGDGNNSGWLGPYSSGTAHNASHTWTVKGDYVIKVKAKDIHGDESLSWSNPLTITIRRSLDIQYPSIFEKIMNRFQAFDNLLTALFNMIQNMRINPSE